MLYKSIVQSTGSRELSISIAGRVPISNTTPSSSLPIGDTALTRAPRCVSPALVCLSDIADLA